MNIFLLAYPFLTAPCSFEAVFCLKLSFVQNFLLFKIVSCSMLLFCLNLFLKHFFVYVKFFISFEPVFVFGNFLFVCLFVFLLFCLFVCLFVCFFVVLFVSLFVCFFVVLFVCWSLFSNMFFYSC